MSFQVTRFEDTPNPNAVKGGLARPIGDRPRSFLNAGMAAADPLATALFEEAGVCTALFNGEWVSVNKPAEADWETVKSAVRKVLGRADG